MLLKKVVQEPQKVFFSGPRAIFEVPLLPPPPAGGNVEMICISFNFRGFLCRLYL